MKKLLKLASITVIFSLILTMVAGCQSKAPSTPQQATAEQKTTATAAKPAQPVNMRYSWWGADDRHKATLAVMDLYTKKFPNVKIEGEYGAFNTYYQKLLTQLAGGTAPDIVSVDYKWVRDLIDQGKPFVNMNDLTKSIDMSGFDMKFVKEQCGDGGNYIMGLPLGINGMGFLYNSKLLKDAGISVDNWDWDQVLEAGAKLKKFDSNKNLLYLTNDHWYYLLKTMLKQKTGNNLIKDDYSLGFSREDMLDVFNYIRKLVDTGVVPPFEESVQYENVYGDQNPNWLNQKYAIFPTSASVLPSIIKASKFDVDIGRYPVMKNPKNPGVITSPSMIVTVYNKSKNIDEAAKFINWFVNDKDSYMTLKDTRGLPAVKAARDALTKEKLIDSNITKMVEQALPVSGSTENSASLSPEIDKIIKDYIHNAGYKKITPEQATDGLMKDVQAKAQELKKK